MNRAKSRHPFGAIQRSGRVEDPIKTSTGVVAQVWRNPPRQALLAQMLRGIEGIALAMMS
jgi:hypothetical protein